MCSDVKIRCDLDQERSFTTGVIFFLPKHETIRDPCGSLPLELIQDLLETRKRGDSLLGWLR